MQFKKLIFFQSLALCEKCSNTEFFFLIQIFPYQSKYGKIRTWKNSVLAYFSHSVACASTWVSNFLFRLVLLEYCGGLHLARYSSLQKTAYYDYCVFSWLLFSRLLTIDRALFFSVLFFPSKMQTCNYYGGNRPY